MGDEAGSPVVGVLFVHGIGEQARGETLLQSGEALYLWLDRWLSRDEELLGEGPMVITESTMLRPPTDRPNAPPCFRMRRRDEEGRRVGAEVLVAESWWAETFQRPNFTEVASWTIGVGPWILRRHAARRWRRLAAAARARSASATAHRLVSALLVSVAATLVGFLLQLIMLALLVVGTVPRFRAAVTRAQRLLAGTIGDSFVLVSSPARFSAMSTQVRADLDWLRRDGGCSKVVVVAHSQGTAVAHKALREGGHAGVERFVTLGSALDKLHVLRQQISAGMRLLGLLRAFGFAVLVLAPILPLPIEATVPIGAGAFVSGFWARTAKLIELSPDDVRVPPDGRGEALHWRDLHASADPVPDGPVLEQSVSNMRCKQVFNRSSLFRDHTVYRENAEQVVGQVALAVADAAGWRLSDEILRHRAAHWRTWRVRALAVPRLLMLAAFVAAWVAVGGALADLGDPVQWAVVKATPNDWDPSVEKALSRGVGGSVAGLAVAGAALLAWYRLVVVEAWRWWDRREGGRLFARDEDIFQSEFALAPLGAALAPLLALAVAAIPLEEVDGSPTVIALVGGVAAAVIVWAMLWHGWSSTSRKATAWI